MIMGGRVDRFLPLTVLLGANHVDYLTAVHPIPQVDDESLEDEPLRSFLKWSSENPVLMAEKK